MIPYSGGTCNRICKDFFIAIMSRLSTDCDGYDWAVEPFNCLEVFYTQNIIRYYKEPEVFAEEIIRNYKSFIVEKAINSAREYLLAENTSSGLIDQGWEVLVASGNYQYEIRYTMISFSEKLYFRWLVNLRTKEINAINSLSEHAMNGKFVINEEEIENEKID